MRPSVLVTGASSGIGAATAVRLAARGFEVFGTSRTPERQSLPGVRFIALDVRDEESVAKGVAQVLASVPRLDALVCNAGIGIFGSVEEVPIEAAREQFETNVFGTLRVLRSVIPHLREARHGRIVILGSLSGRAPIPFQAHYSASKAALDAYLSGLRARLFPAGVQVLTIKPGFVASPMTAHLRQNFLYSSPEQVARGMLKAINLRRDVVYLPFFWGPIMWVIRSIPEIIFKRLKL